MEAGMLFGLGVGLLWLAVIITPRRHPRSQEIRTLIQAVIPHVPPQKSESPPSKRVFVGAGGLLLILGVILFSQTSYTMDLALRSVVVAFFAFGAVVMLLPLLIILSIWRRILEAADRGDYSKAMQIAERLRFFNVSSMLFQKATIMLFAGHYDKAEQIFLEALAGDITSTESPVISMANLAWVMTRQGRYDEAERILHVAAEIHKISAGEIEAVYSNLAEVYLYQGIHPDEALHLAQLAYEAKNKGGIGKAVDRQIWGHILGNQAWALALMGKFAEAEAKLEAAFQKGDPNFAPGYAGVYYRAGRVKLLQGSYKEAQLHFETAVEIAPHSAYAQLSRQALESLLPV